MSNYATDHYTVRVTFNKDKTFDLATTVWEGPDGKRKILKRGSVCEMKCWVDKNSLPFGKYFIVNAHNELVETISYYKEFK
jgi:hypothetical protein